MKDNNLTGWKVTFKKITKIFSWVLVSFLTAVAAFLLYVEFSPKIFGNGYSSGFSLYTIISPSMHPNIKVYDTVVVRDVKSIDDIEVNDVITFISESRYSHDKTVTHRVVDKMTVDGQKVLKTKGDANSTMDEGYTTFDNLIGKVILKIPQLGRIQLLLSSKRSWILVILIPSLFMLIKWVYKLIKLMWIDDKVKKSVQQHEEAYKEAHDFTKR